MPYQPLNPPSRDDEKVWIAADFGIVGPVVEGSAFPGAHGWSVIRQTLRGGVARGSRTSSSTTGRSRSRSSRPGGWASGKARIGASIWAGRRPWCTARSIPRSSISTIGEGWAGSTGSTSGWSGAGSTTTGPRTRRPSSTPTARSPAMSSIPCTGGSPTSPRISWGCTLTRPPPCHHHRRFGRRVDPLPPPARIDHADHDRPGLEPPDGGRRGRELFGFARRVPAPLSLELRPAVPGRGAEFVGAIDALAPRDARAAEGLATWPTYGPPEPGFAEQVYFARLIGDGPEGRTVVLLKAPGGEVASRSGSGCDQLPCFTLWKCTRGLRRRLRHRAGAGDQLPQPQAPREGPRAGRPPVPGIAGRRDDRRCPRGRRGRPGRRGRDSRTPGEEAGDDPSPADRDLNPTVIGRRIVWD